MPSTILCLFYRFTSLIAKSDIVQADESKVSEQPNKWRHLFQHPLLLADVMVIGSIVIAATISRLASEKPHTASVSETTLSEEPVSYRWNFPISQFRIEEHLLQRGDALGAILLQKGLSPQEATAVVESCRGVFPLTSLRMGKCLYFLCRQKGGDAKPWFMVYEPSPYGYVVFQLRDVPCVETVSRPIKIETRTAAGTVKTNLWQALTDSGLNDNLADALIDALAASVDFYRQKVGDRFRVLYEQDVVEGQPVGSGRILAAVYERDQKAHYTFRFNKEDGKVEYYDYEGRPARKAFLKAPVKYSRISSRFSRSRLHPILGYHRPHFGTDYAAPYGTPIIAVADGVVVEATQRGGNGKYVRIRHDKVYETQYLHMSGFAAGIRPGARVVQGQTIGYVGSTGLATGPHVCFRFWKNGQQVDHLRLNLPQPEPISGPLLDAFKVERDRLLERLQAIPYPTEWNNNGDIYGAEQIAP